MKIDTLQIYYDSFINQQNQGEFLRGMADYIELAINDKDCKKIISGIPKTKQRFILENVDSEAVASKKVRLAKKDFENIFENYKKTKDLSFGDNSFELKAQHTFEIERKIKDGQGTTLWEAWGKMCLAYLSIFKKDRALTDSQQRDEYDAFIFKSNPDLASEIKQLEVYSKNKDNVRAVLPEILEKENYKPYINKIHSHLLEELKEKIQSDSVIESKTDTNNVLPVEEDAVFTMTYNSTYRKIFINGHQVRKFSMESENSRIFEDVFNNPNKVKQIKSKRRAQDFVNTFGFSKKAKSLFFPVSAGDRIMLVNPIKKKDLKGLGLDNFTIKDLLTDIRENAGTWSGG